MSPLSRTTPPAPGTPSAAFPPRCPHLPQAPFRSAPPCADLSNSPWPSPSLEEVGPSTWRPLPVEGESTAGTWTTTEGRRWMLWLFYGGEKFITELKQLDVRHIAVLTPGAVYLLTTKGPMWKSQSLRKMLNAGPVSNTKLKPAF